MKLESVTNVAKLTPDSELEHLRDEEYLLFRAKESRSFDSYESKSWLITAQTIYPKDFGIQFEIYKIGKQEKNLREASSCLKTLFENFQNEPVLWAELDSIMSILEEPSCSAHSPPFLAKIFYALPKEVQKSIILAAVQRAKDEMNYVSLMLILTSTFPENTAENGLALVNALLKAEKNASEVLNPFRKKLVCELLPRFLQAEGLEVRPKLLYLLLAKAIEFYVVYSITPTNTSLSKLEVDRPISDPWQDLFSVVRLIGWNLGWELAAEFDCVHNRELILQKVQTMVESGARLDSRKGEEDVREVFFPTVVLFFHAVLDYIQRLNPDFIHGNNHFQNVTSPSMTLVAAFTTQETDETPCDTVNNVQARILLSPPRPTKRLRPSLDEDEAPAILTVSRLSCPDSPNNFSTPSDTVSQGNPAFIHSISGPTANSNLSPGSITLPLISAIKCWRILQSYEALRNEFSNFIQEMKIQKWLTIFDLDVLIYEGKLVKAEAELRKALSQNTLNHRSSNLSLIRTMNLKLASVLFTLNKFSAAAECCLEVIDMLDPVINTGGLTPNLITSSSPNRKHLHVLAQTQSQCLQFVVTLLILSLRKLIVIEEARSDLCLGHLIVLLQFEWPRHCYIFEEVIDIIRTRGCFSYKPFAAFVTTADILEEFMFLSSTYGTSLDILPLPSNTKPQRISTRGADRDSRQDFKIAMRKQMQRSIECVEKNIISYLKRHGSYIPHVFL